MANMKYFIRKEHFDALGKLILVFSMAWVYFFFNEFFLEWYGGEATHHSLMDFLMRGELAWLWWGMIFLNAGIPMLTLWSKKVRQTPWMMLVITLLINVGMYLERYIIVTGIPSRNRMPFDWGVFKPSITEISITIGSFAMFILFYAIMSRLIPLIPVWEVKEGQEAHTLRKVGKATISSVSELE
jgi:molybdopterin-containing oxidoreductase family membrane subunit